MSQWPYRNLKSQKIFSTSNISLLSSDSSSVPVNPTLETLNASTAQNNVQVRGALFQNNDSLDNIDTAITPSELKALQRQNADIKKWYNCTKNPSLSERNPVINPNLSVPESKQTPSQVSSSLWSRPSGLTSQDSSSLRSRPSGLTTNTPMSSKSSGWARLIQLTKTGSLPDPVLPSQRKSSSWAQALELLRAANASENEPSSVLPSLIKNNPGSSWAQSLEKIRNANKNTIPSVPAFTFTPLPTPDSQKGRTFSNTTDNEKPGIVKSRISQLLKESRNKDNKIKSASDLHSSESESSLVKSRISSFSQMYADLSNKPLLSDSPKRRLQFPSSEKEVKLKTAPPAIKFSLSTTRNTTTVLSSKPFGKRGTRLYGRRASIVPSVSTKRFGRTLENTPTTLIQTKRYGKKSTLSPLINEASLASLNQSQDGIEERKQYAFSSNMNLPEKSSNIQSHTTSLSLPSHTMDSIPPKKRMRQISFSPDHTVRTMMCGPTPTSPLETFHTPAPSPSEPEIPIQTSS